jgi:ubiquinone/menaquinone biosynthesis C-methylase UbiE
MKTLNHFEILAPYYDRFIKPHENERFRQICQLPVEGAMLDAGGGTGGKSHYLIGLVTTIIIADSSMGMLRQAQIKGGLVSVCSETEQLPFSDQSFARIIMVDALHHVINYKVTLAEFWRVLEPGGRIVIEEPDIRTTMVKLLAVFEKLALMRSQFISPQQISQVFDALNARINIETEKNIAWVIIDKPTGSNSHTLKKGL